MLESASARALRMGQVLAEYYQDNQSPNGEKYLTEWKAQRQELIKAVAAEDGKTVAKRKALKGYRAQYIRQFGVAPKKSSQIIMRISEDGGDDV